MHTALRVNLNINFISGLEEARQKDNMLIVPCIKTQEQWKESKQGLPVGDSGWNALHLDLIIFIDCTCICQNQCNGYFRSVHLIFNLKKKKKKKSMLFFGRKAYGMLVPWPGIQPLSPAVEARNANHWTTREFWRRPVLIICSSVIQAHQWSDWGSQVLGHSYHRVTLRFMGCPWMLKNRGPRDR